MSHYEQARQQPALRRHFIIFIYLYLNSLINWIKLSTNWMKIKIIPFCIRSPKVNTHTPLQMVNWSVSHTSLMRTVSNPKEIIYQHHHQSQKPSRELLPIWPHSHQALKIQPDDSKSDSLPSSQFSDPSV